jgi:transcriptional regulator with XRE-family HTH domain
VGNVTKNLRRARFDLNIDKQTFAKRAGVGQKSIIAIEQGRTVDPGLLTLAKLALATGLDVPSLLMSSDSAAPGGMRSMTTMKNTEPEGPARV